MKIPGFRIILLILVLVSLAIVPIACGEDQTNSVQVTINPCGVASAPEHCIPPEYFKDAKPPTPVSESAMITIIISGPTFEQFAGETPPGILAVPVSYLDFSAKFTNSTSSPTWHYEKNLAPDGPVAMIRMPGNMYDRMLSMSDGKNLELPVSAYVRQYSNLADLHAQIEPDGMYLKAAAPGSDDTGTGPSPTVPATTLITPPGTQPAPFSSMISLTAIICFLTVASLKKGKGE
ncbi:MAG: hypothetical protein Q7J03_00990 [Methanoregula sp.]|nr:hypothetical protein [Methanoregula sp.]